MTDDYGLKTFKKDLNWKKYPNLDYIIDVTKEGFLRSRDKYDEAIEYRHILNGGPRIQETKDFPRSKLRLKHVKKYLRWRIPKFSEILLENEDMFFVSNIGSEDTHGSILHNKVLNKQFNSCIDKQILVDDAVSRFVVDGTMIAKVEWEYKTVDVEKVVFDNLGEALTDDNGEPITYTDNEVIYNRPFIRFIDLDSFSCDFPKSKRIEDTKFIAHRFTTTIGDLKNDSRYKNIDKILADVEKYAVSRKGYYHRDESDYDRDIVVTECHIKHDIDGDGNFQHIIISWVGDDLIVRLHKNHFRRFPFVVARYENSYWDWFGESDIELLKDSQDINSALTRGMLDIIARNSAGQRGVKKGVLDANNYQLFKKGADYEFNTTSANIANDIYIHQYQELTSTPFNLIQFFNMESESLTGIKPFSDGLNDGSLGMTATGVKSVMDAIGKREMGIFRRLLNAFKGIGTMITELNTFLLNDKQLIEFLQTEENIAIWKNTIPRRDLKIELSTSEDKLMKITNLSTLLQTNSASMGADEAKMFRAKLLELYGFNDMAIKSLNSEPTEQELMMQQLQIENVQLQNEKLKVEIQNIQARAGENEIDQRLKLAKAMNEEAKARKTLSEKDVKDAEFIEKTILNKKRSEP